jgi:hypothetical protein
VRRLARLELRIGEAERHGAVAHSYVAGDRTFCIYLATGEEAVRKHSELSGIPATRIVEVPQIIDPLTANN